MYQNPMVDQKPKFYSKQKFNLYTDPQIHELLNTATQF